MKQQSLIQSEHVPQRADTVPVSSRTRLSGGEQSSVLQYKKQATGFPDNLKAGIENLSGHSMDDVKVHYNSSQPATLQAHAYAQGTDIHVAPGQERHVPHEAWHVVQQKQGRVQATRQLKEKVPVNDEPGLEKEADTMGAQALQAKAAEGKPIHPIVPFAASRGTVQGQFYDEDGALVQDSVLQQVEAYIEEHADHLLKEFQQEAKRKRTEVSLNTWTVGTLGISVMEIQQGKPEKKQPEKPEKGFTFEEKGRRIYTHYEGEKHRDTNLHKQISKLNKEEGTDFSYKHIRTIMENVLKMYPFLTIDNINDALKEGIKNFEPKAKQIKLSGDVNVDLQLLAQHLLRYQSFNRGQLKETKKNQEETREENKFRMLEMEKSKRMLVSSDSRKDLDRLVPPTPDQKKGKGLRDAMPGLIDLNRPLENSIFSQETYKAVFLLAHKTFREAHDLSQKELKKEKTKKFTIDEEIDSQRLFFNQGMFNVIANMENPSEGRDGKGFITDHLGFNYDEENNSFDEGSASSSDSEEELNDDSEMYDSDDNLFTAKDKRNLTVNSFGLFSKVSAQKELLDKTEKRKKHEKIRRKINRRSVKLTNKHEEAFEAIAKESQYVDKKEKSLISLEQDLDQEMGILDVLGESGAQTGDSQKLRSVGKNSTDEISKKIMRFNVKTKGMRGNTIKYKEELTKFKKGFKEKDIRERRKSLNESKERAEELRMVLIDYYENQKVGDIVRKRKKPGNWRKQEDKKLFTLLGPQKMNDFVYEGIMPEIKPKKKKNLKRKPTGRKDKKPTKKKRTE